ncbi:translation initiation factor IF-2 subunit alpha [Methanonatronarchaeum sp. AMET6-2]|uniref:translation initiation factor IF-2 subunit alpha n=1 Tax=Methanonatronarchaeum sp. AMET6-2 TaxID=2933293 RepID=UPI0012012D82|nr:translation initiation factor IF-2 subunit alpha [Methanonatronarchaeum sp. AMET6-2]RZN62603.1 MAG: translation initiation factor IF-2 subunit alpha [Methanonatronarchaeia archaeon]UOY09403.1 translation initiation factor IF-2 subunit alpha [Methanonatronarchaeum sp. AMET6-2]
MTNNQDDYPDVGELVVCRVSNVVDFGAFVELEEYGQKEGLIHISELASGWIKHVKDHVQEDQKVVCKVLEVNPEKQQINLSLKDVNEHQKRQKIQEWKNEQKAERWIEFVAEEMDSDTQTVKKEIINKALDDYGGLMHAVFEDVALEGTKPLTERGVKKEWAETFEEIAKENVEIPYVDITGYLELKSRNSNGVEKVKKALKEGEKVNEDNAKIEISYVGAPYYRVKINAPDYKTAEALLEEVSNKIINKIQQEEGTGKFHRNIEEAE